MATETSGSTAFNPYAAPKAEVVDADGEANGPPFFPVSRRKFAVMNLVTFNVYLIYWSYQNWKCIQRLSGEKLSLGIRALFYPLTAYSLFKRIREHAGTFGVGDSLAAGPLAVAVLVMAGLARLPDPYWLVTLLGFMPFMPVQDVVNETNGRVAPESDRNERYSGWNVVAIVVGVLFLLMAAVGLFLGG